jgi:hypothetical protein
MADFSAGVAELVREAVALAEAMVAARTGPKPKFIGKLNWM